jgi:hypothetical protein
MSDLFEHFYEPRIALDKIKQCNYEYIIFNHPDFDYAIKNKHCIILNIEHTFQIEHQLLFSLLNNYGYVLNRKINYKNFSLFLEFKKQSNLTYLPIKNYDTKMDTISYVNNIQNISKNINSYIDKSETKKFYIWPCSVHTFTLFLFYLNYKKFSGILDNSPNKIGKYIDGYDLLIASNEEDIINNYNKITNHSNKIVFSSEKGCWPDMNLESQYPPAPSSYKYLCAGAYIANIGLLKKLFNDNKYIFDLDINELNRIDDQLFFTKIFLNNKNDIILDYNNNIFNSMFNGLNDLEFKNNKWYNNVTNTYPIILHGNGPLESKDFLFSTIYPTLIK